MAASAALRPPPPRVEDFSAGAPCRRAYFPQHFLDFLREADTPAPALSPKRFSQALHIDLQMLAEQAHVHRNMIARAPGSRGVQGFLREALRIKGRDRLERRPQQGAVLVLQRAAVGVRLQDGREAVNGHGPKRLELVAGSCVGASDCLSRP